MTKINTLEQLLANTDDGTLLDIQEELTIKIVPATGYTHSFIRKVNRMIDQGELCINETAYRKVYLPTFARAVHKELAHRYAMFLKGQLFVDTPESDYEQVSLDLVVNNKQDKMEDCN